MVADVRATYLIRKVQKMAEKKISLSEWNALEIFLYSRKKSTIEKITNPEDSVRQSLEQIIDVTIEKMHNLRLFGLSVEDEKRMNDITLERFAKHGCRKR